MYSGDPNYGGSESGGMDEPLIVRDNSETDLWNTARGHARSNRERISLSYIAVELYPACPADSDYGYDTLRCGTIESAVSEAPALCSCLEQPPLFGSAFRR